MSETTEEKQTRPRRPLVIIGVLASVAAVAAGVVVWTAGSDEPPPADARPARPEPTLAPLRLADEPLWTSESITQSGVSNVAAAGGALLINHGDQTMTLADLATGTARWTFEKRHDLTGEGHEWWDDPRYSDTPRLIGQGGDLGVLVGWEYLADCGGSPGCDLSTGDQAGLALVSGVDGQVIWRTTTIGSYPTSDPERPVQLVPVVTDDIAVVTIAVHEFAPYSAPPLRTIAIDLHTGATLWETTGGGWPSMATGDVLLGTRQVLPDTAPDGEMSAGSVVAMDLRTGQELWSGVRGLDRSTPVLTAADVVLVRGVTDAAPDRLHQVVVAADSGREVAEFAETPSVTPSGQEMECADDDTVIACAYRDEKRRDTVALFRVADRTLTAIPMEVHARVDDVWSGRIFVSDVDGSDRPFTMDAVGNTIDEDLRLPGELADLTGDHAVVFTGEDDPIVEVYEVLR